MDPLITLEPIRHGDVTNSSQHAPLAPRQLKTTLQIYSQFRFSLSLSVLVPWCCNFCDVWLHLSRNCYIVSLKVNEKCGSVAVQGMILFLYFWKRVSYLM
jgi:hypothetical protein